MNSIEKDLLRFQQEIDIIEAELDNPDLNMKAKKNIKGRIKQLKQNMKNMRKMRK